MGPTPLRILHPVYSGVERELRSPGIGYNNSNVVVIALRCTPSASGSILRNFNAGDVQSREGHGSRGLMSVATLSSGIFPYCAARECRSPCDLCMGNASPLQAHQGNENCPNAKLA